MVKINWSIYFLLGISVLIVSYRIDSQKFMLFIWIAYLFMVIGTAKFITWFITRSKETTVEKRSVNSIVPPIHKYRTARFCPKCGNVLHSYENFCPMCGQRLR